GGPPDTRAAAVVGGGRGGGRGGGARGRGARAGEGGPAGPPPRTGGIRGRAVLQGAGSPGRVPTALVQQGRRFSARSTRCASAIVSRFVPASPSRRGAEAPTTATRRGSSRWSATQPAGFVVRMPRSGPDAAVSNSGPRATRGIVSRGSLFVRSAASNTQTPRPSGFFALSSAARASFASALGTTRFETSPPLLHASP